MAKTNEDSMQVSLQTANPGPLGLCAFGLTTILLNLHNTGLFEMNAMILSMGIFYGGIAQIIAGVMEAKKNNAFGFTAFTSYGCFWLSLVFLLVFPKTGYAEQTSPNGMIAYFSVWAVFTFALYMVTRKLGKHLQIIFLTLTILFVLLIIAEASQSQVCKVIAGIEGVVCGAIACYSGLKELYIAD